MRKRKIKQIEIYDAEVRHTFERGRPIKELLLRVRVLDEEMKRGRRYYETDYKR